MIQYTFEIPFGNQPNANGRIYTKETVKNLVDELNSKQFFITKEKIEFDQKKPFDEKEVIGKTDSATYEENNNRVTVKCHLNGDIYEHLKMGIDIVPNGVGELKESGEVTDYQLNFFSITGKSAFRKEKRDEG